MNWFQRMNRRAISGLKHAFIGPPDLNRGPSGLTALMERGPNYSDWLYEQLYGQQGNAVPAACRAHDVMVGALMACQMRVVRQKGDSPVVEELPDHPLNTKLLPAPSRIVSGKELWKNYFSSYIQGNAFLFVRRTSDGLPAELVPVTCSKTQSAGNPLGRAGVRIEHYVQPVYGDRWPEREAWLDMHVIHNHWTASYNQRLMKSLSPITGYASSVIKNNSLLQQHYARRLSRPMPSSAAITMDPSLIDRNPKVDEKQWIEVASQFGTQLADWLKQDKVLTLPPGFDVSKGIGDLDLKAIELLDLTVDEIARIYGVPPSWLYRYHVQSFRALEQENVAFARRSLLMHAQLIGDELSRKLLLPEERLAGECIQLDMTPVELGTLTEQIAAATMATADSGLWKIDEGRALTGKDKLPGGQGDRCHDPRGGPTTRTPQQGVEPMQQVDPLIAQVDPLVTTQNGHGHG